jgi:SsrA-binding protein
MAAQGTKAAKATSGEKLIASNRKAHFDYFLSDYLEVGLSLCGTEIKSLRAGHCSLSDAYVLFKGNEAYICGMDIPPYEMGNIFNHEPKRDRKLLMHKAEILKYEQAVQVKGYTLVPVKCYLKRGKAKLEIALAKGKNVYDKRDTIKDRDIKRKLDEATKERS